MKAEWAERIVRAGQESGLDVEVLEDYAGRGTSGVTTAIVSEDTKSIVAALVAAAAESEPGSKAAVVFVDIAKGMRWDSLGQRRVAY